MLTNARRSRSAQYRWAVKQKLHLKPGVIYTRIKQPYFFSYVIDQLESVYGANTVREGGLRVYTTIEPQAAGGGQQRDPGDARTSPTTRPRRSSRSSRARARSGR